MYREIEQCRICSSTELVRVLDLGVQAPTGVFPGTKSQPTTHGPLSLVRCKGANEACGLLQLQHTYELSELHGQNRGYRSGLNPTIVAHLHEKVQAILKRVTLPKNSFAVDIGSNDATTLRVCHRKHV